MDKKKEILGAAVRPLLDWYDKNQRDLPWRRTRDPYRIWVSEIMLQQTRVGAVLEHYLAWMEALPTVEDLAAVEEERLMKLWQGLGYYSRARNLQKAAQYIVNDLGGRFPDAYEALLALPGVGDYTAGAVASIAFDRPVPAVDGNVLRVAARLANIDEDVMDPKVRQKIRGLMEDTMSRERPGSYNQALMDLGSSVCPPKGTPLCGECPLREICEARRLGLQDKLPVRAKKAPRRVEELTVYVLLREGRVALRKRPSTGLLAGLWEFPHVSGALSEERAGESLGPWGLTALDWRERILSRHLFTHVEWQMTGYVLTVKGDYAGFTWADAQELEALAVPSAMRKYLEAARAALDK